MNRCQWLDSLELEDDAIGDQQIETTFTNPMTFVIDWDWDLSSIGQISNSQLDAERAFVDRFEKARSKNTMNLHRGRENLRDLSIDLLAGLVEFPGGSGVLALHLRVSDVSPAELHLK